MSKRTKYRFYCTLSLAFHIAAALAFYPGNGPFILRSEVGYPYAFFIALSFTFFFERARYTIPSACGIVIIKDPLNITFGAENFLQRAERANCPDLRTDEEKSSPAELGKVEDDFDELIDVEE